MAEQWAEVINPYYGNPKYIYLRFAPRGAPNSPMFQAEKPTHTANVYKHADITDELKQRIWTKRFDKGKVYLHNEYTGEYLLAGSPESRAAVDRMDFIFPIPDYEEEGFNKFKSDRREKASIEREVEIEKEMRRQQREEALAQEAQHRANMEAQTSTGPKLPRVPKEDRERVGNELLKMQWQGLHKFFGFPAVELDSEQKKSLEKSAKKFLTLFYHPDKGGDTELYNKLDNHLGVRLGNPSKSSIVGGRKSKKCRKCGLYKL